MEVTILGACQGESRQTHFASLLVDGVLALDAGSLTSTLTLQEQSAIRSVLLTHQHYDHIKDLATLGFNRLGRGQITICCTPGVRAAVESTILSEEIWLNFFNLPSAVEPTFIHVPVELNQGFVVDGYRVRAVPVRHAVPAVGYEIVSPGGGTLLYTGDSGPGSGASWALTNPDLIVTEATFTNAESDLAAGYGHLSPALLARELMTFRDARGFLPEVAIVHVNPFFEGRIADEIAAVARQLSTHIWLPGEGATITVEASSGRTEQLTN